jgi:hypothetical protein
MRRRTAMKITSTSIIRAAIITVVMAIGAPQFTEGQDAPPERGLAGVWEVNTTPRDCTTGAPILAAAFVAQYTFQKDGTMLSWYSSGTPAPGQGMWRRENGWNSYSFRSIRILRTAAGVFSGKSELGGTLTLNESGDQYTSDEYSIIYGTDGVPDPRPRCLNSVGTRFKMD